MSWISSNLWIVPLGGVLKTWLFPWGNILTLANRGSNLIYKDSFLRRVALSEFPLAERKSKDVGSWNTENDESLNT